MTEEQLKRKREYQREWVKNKRRNTLPLRLTNNAQYLKGLAFNREKAKRRRYDVLAGYSKGIPHCNCCGEKEIKFLSIDHIHGGGQKDRKEKGFGDQLYRHLLRENFPPGYQILCHNCNLSKGFYGVCPHTQNRDII